MNYKFIYSFFISYGVCFFAFSQNLSLLSQYPNHIELENPAAILNENRNEWYDNNYGGRLAGFVHHHSFLSSSFALNPTTVGIYGNRIKKNRFIGLQATYDQSGIIRSSEIGFSMGLCLSNQLILGGRINYSFSNIVPKEDILFFRDNEPDWILDAEQTLVDFNALGISAGLFHFGQYSRGSYFIGASSKIIYSQSALVEKFKVSGVAGISFSKWLFSNQVKLSSAHRFPINQSNLKYFLNENLLIGVFYTTDFDFLQTMGTYFEINIPSGGSSFFYDYEFSLGYSRMLFKHFSNPIFNVSFKTYFLK